MVVKCYCTNSGKDLILDYIRSLPEKQRVDGYSVLQYLENDEIDKIKFKQWKGKIYEIYFYKDNRLYCVVDNKMIYILHTCRKQKNKTERTDYQLVIKRAKEIEKELGKKFI